MPDKEVVVLSEEAVRQIETRASAATEGPWVAYHRISPRGAHKQWQTCHEAETEVAFRSHRGASWFLKHSSLAFLQGTGLNDATLGPV